MYDVVCWAVSYTVRLFRQWTSVVLISTALVLNKSLHLGTHTPTSINLSYRRLVDLLRRPSGISSTRSFSRTPCIPPYLFHTGAIFISHCSLISGHHLLSFPYFSSTLFFSTLSCQRCLSMRLEILGPRRLPPFRLVSGRFSWFIYFTRFLLLNWSCPTRLSVPARFQFGYS